MSIVDMTRVAMDERNADTGAVYHETISLTEALSNVYLIPFGQVYAIAAYITGSGTIEFSNDSPETIESGSPVFIAWDGVSQINLALTAFRVTRSAGTVVAKVTVKTAEA